MKHRQHHVFLFRHCVRSTASEVKHVFETPKETEVDMSDFIDAPLPNWGVAEKWCTPRGLEIMRETGEWLLNKTVEEYKTEMARNNKDLKKHVDVRVEIVSDALSRNADTAFALAQGMADTKMENIRLYGLDSYQSYDPQMFRPLEKVDGKKMCNSETLDIKLIRQQVQRRLNEFPPPQNPNFSETLDQIQSLGGVGNIPIKSISPSNPTTLHSVVDDNPCLLGAVNIIKYVAQDLFYSRASEITPDFLPNATVSQVYALLEWVYWIRSIRYLRNSKMAASGVPLTKAILEALDEGRYHSTNDEVHKDEIRIVLFIGHNDNLNSLATLLDLDWQLPPPYRITEGACPTPPGSAIHLAYDNHDNTIGVDYLFPILLHGEENDSMNPSTTCILKSVPVAVRSIKEIDNGIESVLDPTTGKTILSSQSDTSIIHLLQERVVSILDRNYSDALSCYHADFFGPAHHAEPHDKKQKQESTGDNVKYPVEALMVGIVIGLSLAALLFGVARFIYRKRTKQSSGTPYAQVSQTVDIEMT